jgi:transforming growth factor-beta-induced protein
MNEGTNNKNLYAIVIGVILVIVVAAGVAIFSMQQNKSDTTAMQNQKPADDSVMVGGQAMYKNQNIIENVSRASNLTTLVTAVKAADLVTTLQGPGPFTVFGPTNDAFKKLPAGTLDTLLKPENKSMLQDILKYHVVSGNYKVSDLKDGQVLTTVQGSTLKVTKNSGKTMINGATIETPDVLQSNGVAHVIDTVLLPDPNQSVMVGGQAMLASRNIVDNVSNAGNLTTLVTAVKAADLVTTLQGPGPFTVFGPTNDAFKKLPAGTVETLLLPENKAKLQAVLKYHVVAGNLKVEDLKDGQILDTVNGQKLTVMKKDGKVMIKGGSDTNVATIETANVPQSNGVAHVIDTVLLPQ